MMGGATPHPFGSPMPDEYALAHTREIRESVRRRAERARLRARTGLSSVRPRRESSSWKNLVNFWKGK